MGTYYLNTLGTDGTYNAHVSADLSTPAKHASSPDLTDWAKGNKIWIGIKLSCNNCTKNPIAETLYLEVRKDGGSWLSLALSDLAPPGSGQMQYTDMTPPNSAWWTANDTGLCGTNKADGGATDTGDSVVIDVTTDEKAEAWWAIDFAGAADSSLYEFGFYDASGNHGSAGSPTVLDVSVTMAEGAVDRNINIDDEEATIVVTDVPSVALPDALEISVQEPLITVADEETVRVHSDISVFETAITVQEDVTVSLPDPLEITVQEALISVLEDATVELPDSLEASVFDSAGVTSVLDDILVYQENLEINISEPLITTTDVPTAELPDDLVIAIAEGLITVTDVPTARLPDDLEVSIAEAAITVADIVDDIVVEAAEEEALSIDVYDEVTVTDTVDHIGLSGKWWTTFSEYSLGVPGDWTERWNLDGANSEIVASTDKMSDKELLVDLVGGDDTGISWDAVGNPRNVELLILFRMINNNSHCTTIRGSGDEGSENCYYVYGSASMNQLYLRKKVAGVDGGLDSTAKSQSVGGVYWLRFQALGNQIKARMWGWSAAEPDTWDLESTNSEVTEGWVGVHERGTGDAGALFFSVGTYGESPIEHPLIFESDTTTVTDVVDNIEVVEVAEDYSINVYDEVTVTDVVYCLDVEYHYWTDFSEYSLGVKPSGWTIDVGGTYDVTAGVKTLGGKYVDNDGTLTPGILYPNNAPEVVDAEILVLVNVDNAGSVFQGLVAIRWQVVGNKGYGLIRVITDSVAMYYLDGSAAPDLINQGNQNMNTTAQYWVRFRLEGSTLKSKVWLKGSTEPGSWGTTDTDSTITTKGRCGLCGYSERSEIDYFSIATAGGTAKFPPFMSVYDETTVTEDVTTEVLDAGLSIDVFDSVTVTDVVDDIGASEFFYTSFEEYSLGTPPDWTERWHVDMATPSIQSGGLLMGQMLRLTHDASQRYELSWDAPGTPVDAEVLYLCEPQGDDSMRLLLRGSGDDTSETGYYVYGLTSTDRVYLGYYNNAAGTEITNFVHTLSAGQAYWIRFRVEGDQLKVKIWDKGDPEPGSWNLEETDGTLTSGGWVAAGKWGASSEISFFSVATRGATARMFPLPDVYESVTVTDVVDNIVIADAPFDNISVFDLTTVTEDVTVSLPDPLTVSVFDLTTVEDAPVIEVGAYVVNVYDEVTVADEETVSISAPADFEISVFDTVTVEENVSCCKYDIYWTDFTEYTIGQQPSDWTEQWDVDKATSLVTAGGEFGGKFVRIDHTETFPSGSRYALSWDDPGTPTDGEILALVRSSTPHNHCSLVLRGSGGLNTENGYQADLNFWDEEIRILRWLNGGYSGLIAATSKTLDLDTWYWVRFQVRGTALKMKVWEYQTSEPESWDLSTSDLQLASGWVGIFSSYDDARDFDYFAYVPGTCASVPVPIDIELSPLIYETVTVLETVTVRLPDSLEISVEETAVAVTDVPSVGFGNFISVFDTVTVEDAPTVIVHPAVSVFDTVTVTETVTASLPDDLEISVIDESTILEWVHVTVGVPSYLLIQKDENVVVQEYVAVALSDLESSVYDEATVTEQVAAELPDALVVSVFDLIVLTEDVEVAPELKLSVYDSTSVLESVSIEIPFVTVNVFDSVTVTEDATVAVLVPEFLEVVVFDVVTITESTAGIVSAVILSTFDTITVTESVSLYWLIAAGIARLDFSERSPSIDWMAREPHIHYNERAPRVDYEARI